MQYYHRIQEILAEDQPMIFLYFRGRAAGGRPRASAASSPAPAGILYNFTEWFVPKQLQRYTSG